MERLKEIFVLMAYMVAIVLFPWLSFLMIRSFATFLRLEPSSTAGNILSVLPNIVMFVMAIIFLKMDDWDFKALGLNLKRILPGLVFIVVVLLGLYVFVPYIMTIFYEPRTLVVTFDEGVKSAFSASGNNFWLTLKQPATITYLSNFIRSWVIVATCEEFSARGYMLNKFYSILPEKISIIVKKIASVLFIALFFTLLRFILNKAAGNPMDISMDKLYVIFFYGIFVSYLYLKTNNIYVAIFMQAAFDFSPFGLTVNKVFSITDAGFIITAICFLLLILVLAETYSYWGKPLEFSQKRPVLKTADAIRLNENNPAD